MPRVHTIASLRERGDEVVWCQTSASQTNAHLFAKLLKALLLGQQDETIPQTQDGERRTVTQAKVLAELLRNS
jgi:hypothetical protein